MYGSSGFLQGVILMGNGAKDLKIYMVGPSFHTQGGISSVLSIYKQRLSGRFAMVFIPSYSGKGRHMDVLLFAVTLLRVLTVSMLVRKSIFHIHMASKGSYLRKTILAAMPGLFGRKVIFHIHGAMFDRFMEGKGTLKMQRIISRLSKADKIIVLSRSWFDYFSRYLPAEKLEVVYNPSSTYDGSITRKSNIKPVLLFMGRYGQRKGTNDLLKAARMLEPGSFLLKMYGDGEVDEVRSFVENNGLTDSVEVNGWVDHGGVSGVYDSADILVLPSYAEGLPMSVLEAMGRGLPVVSTGVGGIPEAVLDCDNGYIVAPGDIVKLSERLSLLIKDRELRERMGKRSLQLAGERFSAESIGSRLEAIYEEVFSL